MQILYRTPFAWKLLLVLLFPWSGLVYFAALDLDRKWQTYQEIVSLEELSGLIITSSELVGELQQELNISSLYVSDPSLIHQHQLQIQWEKTDIKLQHLDDFFGHLDVLAYSDDFEAITGWVQGELSEFSLIRDLVIENASKATAKERKIKGILKKYSYLNGLLMDVISSATRQSTNAKILAASSAYVNFLQSQEQFVELQSILNNTLINHRFESGMYKRFLELYNEEHVYQNVFFSFSTDSQLESFQMTNFSDVGISVRGIVDEVLSGGKEGYFENDIDVWVEYSSALRKKQKIIERELKDYLGEMLDNINKATVSGLVIVITLTLFGLTVPIPISVIILKTTYRQLSNLHATMSEVVNNENLLVRADNICGDEIGEMATDLNLMTEKLTGIFKEIDRASLKLTHYEKRMRYYSRLIVEHNFNDVFGEKNIDEIKKELSDVYVEINCCLGEQAESIGLHQHMEMVFERLDRLGYLVSMGNKNKKMLIKSGDKVHFMACNIRDLMDRFKR